MSAERSSSRRLTGDGLGQDLLTDPLLECAAAGTALTPRKPAQLARVPDPRTVIRHGDDGRFGPNDTTHWRPFGRCSTPVSWTPRSPATPAARPRDTRASGAPRSPHRHRPMSVSCPELLLPAVPRTTLEPTSEVRPDRRSRSVKKKKRRGKGLAESGTQSPPTTGCGQHHRRILSTNIQPRSPGGSDGRTRRTQ